MSSRSLVRCIYSSSAYSARPALELRYSFLHVSAPILISATLPSARIPQRDSPLDRPLHSGVSANQRGNEEQDLVPRAAHDVPETLADESCHGTLPVGAERVGDDALAGSATALIGVAPGANVPSVCGQPAAQLSVVVCAAGAVFCAMAGSASGGEEEGDCGRGVRTYVALCFALGSEPPPAIVRCVVGGGRCNWGWWVDVEKAARARGGRRFRARRADLALAQLRRT